MHDEPPTPTGAQAPSLGGPVTPGGLRKERGAIAAQACDTCRSRKQRCDEQRPKCGTCQKFKLDCNYREPQPTKKDRTLMEILDRIKTLEGKVDGLSMRAMFPAATYAPMPTLITTTAPLTMSPGMIDPMATSSFHVPDTSRTTSASDDHYTYASSAHQMMGWPVMQQLLESVRDKVPGLIPATIEIEVPAISLGMHEQNQRIPLGTDGSHGQVKTLGPLSVQVPGAIPLTIPSLTWDTMQRLGKAYFDSFNFVFPILDRHEFFSEVMPSTVNGGFSDSMASTLALLVFALGELAISGSQGLPIRVYNGRASGLKGGNATEPPGLVLFNEARRRMGFNLAECSLENVQIFALASIFYGAGCHNMELWRMTTSASLACQALISSKPSELSSPRGDIFRRAFWHCSMMETCLTLELGLPSTGLNKFEQIVGLPDFSGPYTQEDYLANQSSHFQEHFASQIVLRRLLMDFHNILSQALLTPSASASSGPGFSAMSQSSAQSTASSQATIKQLALQLDQWRGMLPVPLRWHEDSPGAFPTPSPGQDVYHQSIFPSQPLSPTAVQPTPSPSPSIHHSSTAGGQRQHQAPPPTPPLMFTTDLDVAPTAYPYALDIQVALLRTRYYYTKYLIHRPFLYKALHHPDSMTGEDASGAATCLRAALKWPLTMSPTCTRKRLVPCLFFWTQNVLGILLVLRLASTAPMLQRIVRGGLCGGTWEMDASETVGLYIDWLRDLKEVDGAAGWAWEVVRAVYGLE